MSSNTDHPSSTGVFHITDAFLPSAAPKVDRDFRRRARLLVVSSLVVVLCALPMMLKSFMDSGRITLTVTVFVIGVALVALNPILLGMLRSTRIPGVLLCLELLVALGLLSFLNIGVADPAIIWTLAVPVLAGFLVGPLFSALCALLIAIEVAALFFLVPPGRETNATLTPEIVRWWYAAGIISLGAFLALLARVYERSRSDAETALRHSQEQLSTVVSTAPLILFVLDRDGHVLLSEGRGLQALGSRPGEAVGRSAFEIYREHPAVVDNLRRALIGEARSFTATVGGRTFEARCAPTRDDEGRITGVVGAGLDTTEGAELRDSLIAADRLASVGVLAAGVAHEINNPLTYIIANLQMLRDELPAIIEDAREASDWERMLSDTLEGSERVKHIVRDLKTFSRADAEEQRAVDLQDVLDKSIKMVRNEIRHSARLVKEYGPVPRVMANEARIGQIAINLMINATQAMTEGSVDDNQLTVTTRTDEQGRAVIAITDTGQGIPADSIEHIFQPFMTTKPVGEGTGLGLSVCRNIVGRLGGEITVESEPGRGSTFTVTLPPALAEVPRPRSPDKPGHLAARKILLVDDDPRVLRGLARMLRDHEVTLASGGAEALEHIAADEFDLILCDVMMPDIDAMELYDRVCVDHPGVEDRMAFMTGGAFRPQARSFLDQIPNPHYEKPISSAQLRELVLGAAAPATEDAAAHEAAGGATPTR